MTLSRKFYAAGILWAQNAVPDGMAVKPRGGGNSMKVLRQHVPQPRSQEAGKARGGIGSQLLTGALFLNVAVV